MCSASGDSLSFYLQSPLVRDNHRSCLEMILYCWFEVNFQSWVLTVASELASGWGAALRTRTQLNHCKWWKESPNVSTERRVDGGQNGPECDLVLALFPLLLPTDPGAGEDDGGENVSREE